MAEHKDEREREQVAADSRATALDDAAAAASGGYDEAADTQLEGLQAEVAALTDRHLRLAAEFANYRKRTERERAEQYTRAQSDLVKRLLDPIDDLERVGDYTDSTAVTAVLEGIQLVERKLLQSLQSAGLEAIDPAG